MTELTNEERCKAISDIGRFVTGPYASQPGYLKNWGDELQKHSAELLRRLGDAVSASPQPRCPKCGHGISWEIGGKFAVCNKAQKTDKGYEFHQFEIKSISDFAQFFAPAQEPQPVENRCGYKDCTYAEDSQVHSVDLDLPLNVFNHQFQPISGGEQQCPFCALPDLYRPAILHPDYPGVKEAWLHQLISNDNDFRVCTAAHPSGPSAPKELYEKTKEENVQQDEKAHKSSNEGSLAATETRSQDAVLKSKGRETN
jgi:hypothetical protein